MTQHVSNQSHRLPPSPLATRRLVLGLRQSDVATLAGIQRGHLSRLERGVNQPGWGTVQRLAAALTCQPADIFPTNVERPAANGAPDTTPANGGGRLGTEG